MFERLEIVADLREAFETDLADAVVGVTITKYDTQSYDPLTGEPTQTLLASMTIPGIFTGQWQYEVFNANVEPNDETLLILQDDTSFKPEIGNIITSNRGKTRIIEIKSDPMNVTYELRVRF